MPSNYSAIRAANVVRFGTDIGRIGKMLLAERYDDRTHFIYELLQNAEDAMARRRHWHGKRSAAFHLSRGSLTFTHFGIPFNEQDVRGICGIAESTKQIGSIGRFGIGFKSVYAFTSSPEIHSQDEHFAIDSFVLPRAVPAIAGEMDQTVLRLPLNPEDKSAMGEIEHGLRRLGLRALLFLREIEEIEWSVEGGGHGLYVRGPRKRHAEGVKEVELVEEIDGITSEVERWLICSKEVPLDPTNAGKVEIAFQSRSTAPLRVRIAPIPDAVLVAFFPTIVPTHLGFLIQGPYRTTPSRDNVLRQDPMNRRLVAETAKLLRVALSSLRDVGELDVSALNTLPLDRTKFGEASMFAYIFDAVLEGFLEDHLLPRFRGGYVSAATARLARTQDLRELLEPGQLTALLQSEHELSWLSEAITADREPTLRNYLLTELHVPEVTWEALLAKLTASFLEAQPAEWVRRLYETLGRQPALINSGKLHQIPLIRLEDGAHVAPLANGRPQAFLPGKMRSGFPTVSATVLGSDDAKSFLTNLGLTEPDPVDDVIVHVLPRYASTATGPRGSYAADIARILAAFATDSKSRREKLIEALTDTPFVIAVDAGDGQRRMAKPGEVYIPTERLKELFDGVAGVLLVDSSEESLHGEAARDLLTVTGVSRYLARVPIGSQFSSDELSEMRKRAGWATSSGYEHVEDFTIRGLEGVLRLLPQLSRALAAAKARALWMALNDLDTRTGPSAFVGRYTWSYQTMHTYDFDAFFLRSLNQRPWIPDCENEIRLAGAVSFESISPPWEPNQRLLAKIHFKPPVLDMLAREAGIDPEVLEILKALGLTSAAQLRDRLQIADDGSSRSEVAASGIDRGDRGAQPSRSDGESENSPNSTSTPTALVGSDAANGADDVRNPTAAAPTSGESEPAKPSSRSDGAASQDVSQAPRVFVSYIGVERSDETADTDALGHQKRLKLESAAIDLVISREPRLQRTPLNNPGFDLVENDNAGKPNRWVEVKAMTGTLEGRPVGLSHTQFEKAQEEGERYWLYVVENAGSPDVARVIRIRNPARRASTFVFDRGWSSADEPLPPK